MIKIINYSMITSLHAISWRLSLLAASMGRVHCGNPLQLQPLRDRVKLHSHGVWRNREPQVAGQSYLSILECWQQEPQEHDDDHNNHPHAVVWIQQIDAEWGHADCWFLIAAAAMNSKFCIPLQDSIPMGPTASLRRKWLPMLVSFGNVGRCGG